MVQCKKLIKAILPYKGSLASPPSQCCCLPPNNHNLSHRYLFVWSLIFPPCSMYPHAWFPLPPELLPNKAACRPWSKQTSQTISTSLQQWCNNQHYEKAPIKTLIYVYRIGKILRFLRFMLISLFNLILFYKTNMDNDIEMSYLPPAPATYATQWCNV